MDIDTLRLFIAACEAGSLVKVASREHLSPSSLTKRLQKLERDMGAALLQRTHRGIKPTMAGQLLIEKSMHFLRDIGDIRELMSMYGTTSAGMVSVMGSYSMTAGSLIEDLAEFLMIKDYENIKINLAEGDKQAIVEAVRDGKVAIGILWNATETAGLETYPYRSDDAAVVVRQDHPLASRSEIAYEDIVEYGSVRTKTTHKVELMLKRRGNLKVLTKHNRIEVPSFEALLRTVEATNLLGLCPIQVARVYSKAFKLKAIALTDSWAARQHVVVCANAEELNPAARALLQHLRAKVSLA